MGLTDLLSIMIPYYPCVGPWFLSHPVRTHILTNEMEKIMNDETTKQELTFGGKSVGLSFNPSNNGEVDLIKAAAANFIDQVCSGDGHMLKEGDGEVIAMRKLALRAAQEAQMWAVKAVTWNS